MNLNNNKIEHFADRLISGDTLSLSRAITLVESTRNDHIEQAHQLLKLLMPNTGGSIRIGISGVPGVGKSTFIEALGTFLIGKQKRVAVLAVDPSSSITGGSILGDKTRMEKLSTSPNAFIRPSPSGATLGGVARRTRESILLCEAAGFDVVIVETVGVGQSETMVAGMTDVFVLLMLPGGGDDLQGIKRGILELADLVVINKADGEMQNAASRSAADYQNALQYVPSRFSKWKVPIEICSAVENKGIENIWNIVEKYFSLLRSEDEMEKRRIEQSHQWMWQETADGLFEVLKEDTDIRSLIAELEVQVAEQKIPASIAAREIIQRFLKNNKQI